MGVSEVGRGSLEVVVLVIDMDEIVDVRKVEGEALEVDVVEIETTQEHALASCVELGHALLNAEGAEAAAMFLQREDATARFALSALPQLSLPQAETP